MERISLPSLANPPLRVELEELPVVLWHDDIGVGIHPGVGSHEFVQIKERSHRPVQLQVEIEVEKIAGKADPAGVSIDQDCLAAGRVAAELLERDAISHPEVAVDGLQAIPQLKQVVAILPVVELNVGRGVKCPRELVALD